MDLLDDFQVNIPKKELARHGCTRLTLLRVEVGVISGVVHEALSFGFEALVRGTEHEKAKLELVTIPLRLACGSCGTEFDGADAAGSWSPCPHCGEVFGHRVLTGKELRVVWLEGA